MNDGGVGADRGGRAAPGLVHYALKGHVGEVELPHPERAVSLTFEPSTAPLRIFALVTAFFLIFAVVTALALQLLFPDAALAELVGGEGGTAAEDDERGEGGDDRRVAEVRSEPPGESAHHLTPITASCGIDTVTVPDSQVPAASERQGVGLGRRGLQVAGRPDRGEVEAHRARPDRGYVEQLAERRRKLQASVWPGRASPRARRRTASRGGCRRSALKARSIAPATVSSRPASWM